MKAFDYWNFVIQLLLQITYFSIINQNLLFYLFKTFHCYIKMQTYRYWLPRFAIPTSPLWTSSSLEVSEWLLPLAVSGWVSCAGYLPVELILRFGKSCGKKATSRPSTRSRAFQIHCKIWKFDFQLSNLDFFLNKYLIKLWSFHRNYTIFARLKTYNERT